MSGLEAKLVSDKGVICHTCGRPLALRQYSVVFGKYSFCPEAHAKKSEVVKAEKVKS